MFNIALEKSDQLWVNAESFAVMGCRHAFLSIISTQASRILPSQSWYHNSACQDRREAFVLTIDSHRVFCDASLISICTKTKKMVGRFDSTPLINHTMLDVMSRLSQLESCKSHGHRVDKDIYWRLLSVKENSDMTCIAYCMHTPNRQARCSSSFCSYRSCMSTGIKTTLKYSIRLVSSWKGPACMVTAFWLSLDTNVSQSIHKCTLAPIAMTGDFCVDQSFHRCPDSLK